MNRAAVLPGLFPAEVPASSVSIEGLYPARSVRQQRTQFSTTEEVLAAAQPQGDCCCGSEPPWAKPGEIASLEGAARRRNLLTLADPRKLRGAENRIRTLIKPRLRGDTPFIGISRPLGTVITLTRPQRGR
jgi:hypothetical protein